MKVIKNIKNSMVGIDFGCKNLITINDGIFVENPHFLKESEKKLKETQSKYSKMKYLPKTNKKKIKIKKKLNKLHTKVKNQRQDFLHKESRKLVNKYGIICIEDLNIKSMTKDNWKGLNKSILDSGWSMFTNFLEYKAEEAGIKLVKVNPKNTSQMCSGCGKIVKKDLNVRMHSCDCGLEIDRDINAARNILRLGAESLGIKPLEATKLV